MSWLHLTPSSAGLSALVLLVLALALRPLRAAWSGWVSAAATETALVCGLFALWQLGNRVAHHHLDGGLANGRAVWDAERALHLPSETAMQTGALADPTVVQAANTYYATAHLTGMLVFLVWMWLRHRDHYARWRTVLVVFTGMSLLVQIAPVAPPRLLDGIGMTDTAAAYGQSVYALLGDDVAGQYGAMPSIHVGWALLIAAACWSVCTGWWRAVGLAHGLLTAVVVVMTANHYWLDGVAAAVLLVLACLVQRRLPGGAVVGQIQQGAFSTVSSRSSPA